MSLPSHDRFAYRAIVDRLDYDWPQGRRLAVYLGVNLEHFAFGDGLGARIGAPSPEPDILNYAWREYGNRVGAWRMMELLDELALPASVLANTAIYDHAPELMAAFRRRGDEVVAHGRSNAERQDVLDEAAERRLIGEVTARIAVEEGEAPTGWLSPWIAETAVTPDLLAAAGYRYTLNWCMDDQPVWMATRSGALLAVPYQQELNDIPAIVGRLAGAAEFADMIVDQIDEMALQCRRQPLVLGLALHPYIMGQPFRLRQLRRALRHLLDHGDLIWPTTAGAVARHVTALPPGTVPGPQDREGRS